MKIAKRAAGLMAMALVASSAAIGVVASPAQAAEGSTSGTIAYNCGLVNGIGGTISNYTGIKGTITVSPATTPEGGQQAIKIDLGGNGTTADGPSPFDNGPYVPVVANQYQGVFNISIDGDDPINVVSPTPHGEKDPGDVVWPNGLTGTINVTQSAGSHTVELEQFVVNSSTSGDPWVTGAETNVATNAATFDSICNSGTDQATIVGNNAPGTQGPAVAQPSKYLSAFSTSFAVTGCEDDTPTGTSTELSVSPTSPRVVGTEVTLTAEITPASCNLGSKTVAGTVQFKNDGDDLGDPQPVSSEEATLTVDDLPVGSNALTATFIPTDDSGADGFVGSNSNTVSFTITSPSTSTPTPPPTTTPPTNDGVDTAPRSATAKLANVYCETFSKADAGEGSVTNYKNWDTTIKVSPGAAAPGSTVKVTVSVAQSPKNGPATELEPGAYRFQPTVSFQGKNVTFLNGSVSKGAIPQNQPIYTSLPTTASGTVTLPSTEGEFPIKVVNLNYNNIVGSIATEAMDDPFDNICNASTAPNDSPKAFNSPSVNVLSSNEAPEVDEEVPGEDGNGGGGGSGNEGVLAATGAKELLALGLLALLALQVGAVVTVRAHRAAPRTPRGPRHL